MSQQDPKKILVTGAAGFVGARFVESCNQQQVETLSVDHKDHFSRPEHRGVNFGRVIDRSILFECLEIEKPEVEAIVHLGACTDTTQMDQSYLKKMNLDYSKAIWNYATEKQIPLVYASSAATYGGGENGYDDTEEKMSELAPLNPYGVSKLQFDLWALEEERQKRQPPAWSGFKFFNVYGFGERHKTKMSSVVLKAFDQINKTGKVRLFRSHKEDIRDGEQKRDFVFVRDVIQVLHFALRQPLKRGIYNLGSGQARSFLDLANAVFHELGQTPDIEFIDTPEELRARYQYFTQANMQKLRESGYRGEFASLEAGVHHTVSRLKKAGS